MTMIPYGKQSISKQDKQAVLDVLGSDFLTQGPKVNEFESAVANYCGSSYAVAANSATSCLHVACLALGLSPGDWLWTSPNSFIASSNCGLYCGAKVDFVDICQKTYNMSVKALHDKLIQAKVNGTLPKVVVPVHFAGQPCDMKAIYELSREYGFHIIEDASHAVGASYDNCRIGKTQYSDIAVFSFHPVKVMTTAEGGMALTNSEALFQKMKRFVSHGVTRDQNQMTSPSEGPWYYQMLELGFNYRMTELQAALGLSQLKRLDSFLQRRTELAHYYVDTLDPLPLILPFQASGLASSWHLFVVCVDSEKTDVTRKEAFLKLREAGIGVNVHYIPIHLQPYYCSLGFKEHDFPIAESYYQHCLSLPLYYDLKREEQQKVVDTLFKVFS